MLLGLAERRRNIAETLAVHIADRRNPSHIRHTVADVLRGRMLAIGCGYPDGNDFDWPRRDPAFKLARSGCNRPDHSPAGQRRRPTSPEPSTPNASTASSIRSVYRRWHARDNKHVQINDLQIARSRA
jgi:hypothetical protein